ncbi:glycosyltransferase [Psychrobacter cryohalolentis]|nr:glycosyltransferase [Psychrobacter cryohalolentis]ASE27034.1 hypothetical protein CEP87_10750 [Psychrobacter cryohalolentis]
MKILIVSTFFPPQNSIASLRPYSWAKWWSRMGHDVTVLTTPKPQKSSDMPMSYEGFKAHEIPVPLLSTYSLRKAESLKALVGDEVLNEPTKTPWFKRSVFFLSQKYGMFYGCRFPDFTDLWTPNATKWAINESWDLVVSTGGPYTVHRVGLAIKKKNPNTKWIVDWRDLWTDNHLFPGFPIFEHYERNLENRFHKYADLITTVSKPLANKIQSKVRSKVEVVYNGYDLEDFEALSDKPYFPKDDMIRIVYTGSIYKGKQDPSPLFRAIANLKKSIRLNPDSLKVFFAGNNSDVTSLASEYDVEEFCEYLGFLPREDALRAQRDANILLFLEFEAPGITGVLTGKIFEYLATKKYILGVGATEETSTGQLIVSSGHGSVVGKDVKLISQTIKNWIEYGVPDISLFGKDIVEEFSRKIQAENVLAFLDKA